jgi:hypothetical protein
MDYDDIFTPDSSSSAASIEVDQPHDGDKPAALDLVDGDSK